ncbi:MAG TPA: hypothetical protein VEV85_17925 [Bryobacteraceae bacterium]|nr:hypothetical protein [Bryobacteraceae bacterium]
MAVIQYNLQFKPRAKKKYSISWTVLAIDKNDRIQFHSNVPGVGIEYLTAPPFKLPGPKGTLPIQIPVKNGKALTGPFKVTKTLNGTTKVHFKCGTLEMPAPQKNRNEAIPAKPKFKAWRVGGDHPPGDTDN